MDLPTSVTGLGEQLGTAGAVAPDPALHQDPEVFAAERGRIFARPLMAIDHATRLSEDSRYFCFDAAPRSIIVTRDSDGGLYALRNVCIHAGYPVCDAGEGAAERLICPYHGWEFTLDGKLVEPDLSSRIDPSRLRLASYPVAIRKGLIFVDPSGDGGAVERFADLVPDWLPGATVTRRARHSTAWNWKFLHHFLRSSPHLFFDDMLDRCLEFGPLSWLIIGARRAVLIRIIPKFAEQTDFELVEMAAEGAAQRIASDGLDESLRSADRSPGWFGRGFAEWYWSMMSEAPETARAN